MTNSQQSSNNYNFSLSQWNYRATRYRRAMCSASMSIFHNFVPCYHTRQDYSSYIHNCRLGSSGRRQNHYTSSREKVSHSLFHVYEREKRCSFFISSHFFPNFLYPTSSHIHFICGRSGNQNATYSSVFGTIDNGHSWFSCTRGTSIMTAWYTNHFFLNGDGLPGSYLNNANHYYGKK